MSLIERTKLKKELLEGLCANGRVKSNVKKTINGKEETLHEVSARNAVFGSVLIYVKERPPRIVGHEVLIKLKNPFLLSTPRLNLGDGDNTVAFFERSIYAEAIIIEKNEDGVK